MQCNPSLSLSLSEYDYIYYHTLYYYNICDMYMFPIVLLYYYNTLIHWQSCPYSTRPEQDPIRTFRGPVLYGPWFSCRALGIRVVFGWLRHPSKPITIIRKKRKKKEPITSSESSNIIYLSKAGNALYSSLPTQWISGISHMWSPHPHMNWIGNQRSTDSVIRTSLLNVLTISPQSIPIQISIRSNRTRWRV